jgi:hypothetical protein
VRLVPAPTEALGERADPVGHFGGDRLGRGYNQKLWLSR